MANLLLVVLLPLVCVLVLLILLKIFVINGRSCNFTPNLSGKVAIVTGIKKKK